MDGRLVKVGSKTCRQSPKTVLLLMNFVKLSSSPHPLKWAVSFNSEMSRWVVGGGQGHDSCCLPLNCGYLSNRKRIARDTFILIRFATCPVAFLPAP